MGNIVTVIKGVVIGLATLVPGVSGGTMAIILGVYDDLIHSISSFFKDWKKNSLFLIQIGIGAVVGMGAFSKIIEQALVKYENPMIYLFLGIICGGIPVLYKKSLSPERKKSDLMFLVIGFIIVFIMTLQPSAVLTLATDTGVKSTIFLVIAGFIIAVALILPGISTSFMLLTLGLYSITLEAINTFNLAYLLPIVIGAVIGTLSTTKLIENLLQKYPSKTYLLILGFVIGSLLEVFSGIPEGFDIIYCIITFIVGFTVIKYMSRDT
ncbi:DUF368 domain-containing protein [Clostridium intestinale]|uniref:Putative membrane protein n=1 Tax=Clostridium intestinale DSM 6191 TaxID=1121320 RepID=A0A1M5YR10_9CLOT|nr:DUF368 domain-containing protein [Clostridium intestinale]SHI14003.1 putative membrane protein [Clostridium intestinale DSM 6191]